MPSDVSRSDWIWRNGEFVPWEEATLHVMSHVVHYGSSAFEGIRCYATPEGPSIFRLADHLKRLADSCRVCRMDAPFGIDDLGRACVEIVTRNAMDSCYIRPVVLRGPGAYGVDPRGSSVDVYVVCWPWGPYLGRDGVNEGIDVCVSSWFRPSPNTHPTLAKIGGNYLNAQLIKMDAIANGFAEGIALAPNGTVSEASAQNLFYVRGGTVYTPSVDGTMLSGITRDCVLHLSADAGLPVRETVIPREALYAADEVFLTGTASEITPVRSIDRIAIGEGRVGPVTRLLQSELLAYAKGETPDRYGWRTLVGKPLTAAAAVM